MVSEVTTKHIELVELENDSQHNLVVGGHEKAFPTRSAFVAGFMVLAGIICFVIGLDHLIHHGVSPLALVSIGTLLLIPGIYHGRHLILAYRRVPGYTFDQVASFRHVI